MSVADRLDGQPRRWSVPDLDALGPVTVGDLEGVHGDAYAQGFQEGRRDGERRGHEEATARVEAELAPRVAHFAALARALGEPLEQVDEAVEHSLVALATAVARQLVHRELSLHPEQIVAVVRESMSALPLASRGARITLHPDDLALVRDALDFEAQEGNLRLLEDSSLTRGGCRVQTDVSLVDATVEARLESVITQVLGGERAGGGDDTAALSEVAQDHAP
jgi:flagellar assembly protein FliH